MMTRFNLFAVALLFMLCSVGTAFGQNVPVPSLMNFQGRLTRPDGTPVANGTYAIRFSLWNTASGGTEKWNQTVNPVTVRNGTFAVLLSGFPTNTFANNLWMEIKIGTDSPLTPRQQLVSVAYAMKADSVKDGAITGSSIANGTITADKLANNAFSSLAWLFNGNAGVTSGFLGTTDNQPLEFRVNNRRAMRYSYAEREGNGYRSINVLGGSEINEIAAGVTGATISGGGRDNFDGTDLPNRVLFDFGTVGGGMGNTANGAYATVAGVWGNRADALEATVGGGTLNTASSGAATVGGGVSNTASGSEATIGGGTGNSVSGVRATVGGGYDNHASNYCATVAGGFRNTASGNCATVAAGSDNSAVGDNSFAAGFQAKANHSGSFVWADSMTLEFVSTAANQFNVRASGGVRIFSNNTATTGVLLGAGGGSWSSASDRNLKANFQNVDTLDVLEKLIAMPLTTWNYKANASIKHIGPMAQDFYAAFGGLGMDDKHIDTVDADGVAFAAIQGLHRKLQASTAELKKENTALKAEVVELKAKNAEMEARLAKLEATLHLSK